MHAFHHAFFQGVCVAYNLENPARGLASFSVDSNLVAQLISNADCAPSHSFRAPAAAPAHALSI